MSKMQRIDIAIASRSLQHGKATPHHSQPHVSAVLQNALPAEIGGGAAVALALSLCRHCRLLLHVMQGRPFIFNLGHGITPDAKIECMQALVDTVVSFR